MTSTMLGAQLLAKGKFIGCVVVRMPCDVEVDMYNITGMFSIAMTALASSPSFQEHLSTRLFGFGTTLDTKQL